MARATNPTTDEIVRRVNEWAAAERRGDPTVLDSILAADVVGIAPRGFMLTKEQ